jgi:hypothetical protein
MEYISSNVRKSAVCPGVEFTTQKFSWKHRTEIELQLSEYSDRATELITEYLSLANDDSAETKKRKKEIDRQYGLTIEQHYKPTYLRVALASVAGLTINGNASPDTELLLASGPPELVDEIYDFIKSGIEPDQALLKNSEQPSTSAGLEAPEIPLTPASPANNEATS